MQVLLWWSKLFKNVFTPKYLHKTKKYTSLTVGGGSALLPSPVPPITLQDVGKATKLLQSHGATIQQLNLVRKNIELLKGGGLAKQALPAKVIIYYTHTSFNKFRSQHSQRVNPTDMYRLLSVHTSKFSRKSQVSKKHTSCNILSSPLHISWKSL